MRAEGLELPTSFAARAPCHPPRRATPPDCSRSSLVSDLLPVVDCLKQDNMDAVQGCMDQLEPWLELTEGGGLSFSLNAVNGFIGGTVGVLGTVGATLVKKAEVKDRLKCVYCEGSGQILCGHCFGTKKLSYIKEDKTVVLGEDCANCETTGSVVCINCQGSGLSVPDDFLQVLGDEEVRPTPTRGLDSSRRHGPQPMPVTPTHAMGSTPSRLVRMAGRLYRGGLHRPL